jgi:hypothetical protein
VFVALKLRTAGDPPPPQSQLSRSGNKKQAESW